MLLASTFRLLGRGQFFLDLHLEQRVDVFARVRDRHERSESAANAEEEARVYNFLCGQQLLHAVSLLKKTEYKVQTAKQAETNENENCTPSALRSSLGSFPR